MKNKDLRFVCFVAFEVRLEKLGKCLQTLSSGSHGVLVGRARIQGSFPFLNP